MKILSRSDKESLWGDICDEIFAMYQQQRQQAVITGKKLQNNEQTITAAIALPATKAKNSTNFTNFLYGDSS